MKNTSLTNNAKIDTEVVPADNEKVQHSTHWLKRAGEAIRPAGFDYVGSAVVHYYQGKFKRDDYTTVCQALISRIEEGLADLGWKNLRKELMRKFGRTEKQRT